MRIATLLSCLFVLIACESRPEPTPEPEPGTQQPAPEHAVAEALDEGSEGSEGSGNGTAEEKKEDKLPRVEGDLCYIKDEASFSKIHADKIQVIVRKKTEGQVVKAGDMLTAHYRGLLFVNGKRAKQFDSSFDRGEPADFPIGVGNVIPGWDKVLVGRRVGDEVTIIIPYQFGYGANGNPRAGIPGKSTLIFDVTIVKSKPRYITIAAEKDWNKDKSKELQVVIVKRGKGATVMAGDMLKCHYRGQLWLAGKRGKQFDSSYDRGQPAEFPIGIRRVIPGWDQSLTGLPVGSKVIVIIPSHLAYGPQSPSPDIPANSDLVFDVEILAAKSMRR